MAYWLVKTEPSECGIDDFAREPERVIPWDGVRNYQARNFLRAMTRGDRVFLYHSSCQHIGIAGIVRVVREAYPDPTQFDPESPYHDPKSRPDAPRWQAVDMVFERKLQPLVTLDTIKNTGGLSGLALIKRGNRLSVMPVSDAEWQILMTLPAPPKM
ncbi:EVE domain-containing protein [Marinobacter caseinilyticus]|uniref:EVE domain-containing protein n=1 Tax=Marinobacter caseinilyticus TaxID=2692195 RepID=UPI00140B69F5|nr:EVE domain-containing protein [Marinobacter caseinilyticus]